MSYVVKSPRKLIEVALPLDAINVACVREKSISHGHPRTVHLWWARRPLAAARAVLFAQLVNDPGYQQGEGFKYGKNKKDAANERKRLFKIIEDIVQWKNTTNKVVMERARFEIRRSWHEVCELNKDHPQATELFNPEKLPAFHDPFAGGGAIPLEAQRLGLESYASDLNPVAVLINKAMIEIPPKFAGQPPVSLAQRQKGVDADLGLEREWPGTTGLVEDVRYYGAWMSEEAKKRIGHLYPLVEITAEMARERSDLKPFVGKKFTVIAWLWARTVKSPNPAFSHVDVPLASTFILCSKNGKEAYVQPIVTGDSYHFTVKLGSPTAQAKLGTKAAGRGSAFHCIISDTAISGEYIKSEGKKGLLGAKMIAIVVDGPKGRLYLSPIKEHEFTAVSQAPDWTPDVTISGSTQYLGIKPYGMLKFSDIFSLRQTVALAVFSDLVSEARRKIRADFVSKECLDQVNQPDEISSFASDYVDAVAILLGLSIGRLANRSSTLNFWDSVGEKVQQVFARQALSMTWDYTEGNPFSDSSGNYLGQLDYLCNAVINLPANNAGSSVQADAQRQIISAGKVISTDPPYFDNVPYADLADFFYVWLRRCLKPVLPNLFDTVATPKEDELVAFAYRHADRSAASKFFMDGMTKAMQRLASQAHIAFPVTIYYAFRASETESEGTASTGWEKFLDAVFQSGFSTTGTWPMRTEYTGNLKTKRNALASSIILVCRKRPMDAPTISRREFIRELNGVLPEALDEMTKGAGGEHSPVAPVDLSQAIIGPGMAVFSKYAAVLEADGSPMSVRTALQLINRFLTEDDFDADTQFCLHWFEQHGWNEGAFGDAETLSRGKGTSVDGIKDAGVLRSGAGKVRLLKWSEYPKDWDPKKDMRLPVWEALHQLIRALKQGGESASGELLSLLGGKAEAVRQLAYRLYTLCERLGQAEDARAYNELITSWTGIELAAGEATTVPQLDLFGEPQ